MSNKILVKTNFYYSDYNFLKVLIIIEDEWYFEQLSVWQDVLLTHQILSMFYPNIEIWVVWINVEW